MKIIRMIIGIILVLALCITPVVAVSADDFAIYINKTDPHHETYKYYNLNNQSEIYTYIATGYTIFTDSLVTFKPANIPDAPTMEVDTYMNVGYIYLPRCVDEWEIKYYSCIDHLKNAGVVNLKETFEEHIDKQLYLARSPVPHIASTTWPYPTWYISEVKK